MQIKNIKFNWKTIFIIGLIITFLNGCKVQAVSRSDYISLESTYTRQSRNLDFFNNLLNDYYGRNDIDLSEFSGIGNIDYLITSKNYYSALIPDDNNKIWVRTSMDPMYFYVSQSSGGYTFVGNWLNCIDIDNKKVISASQDDNYLTKASVEYKNIITSEKWYSNDFQEFLLYNYVLFYNGEIKNRSRNKILNYEQRHNKNNLWDYTEDGIYSYWSGDITLYEDYFEVKGFETNVSDFSMYLLQYTVVPNEFREYVLTNSYSWFEISKPNQGETSTWQISNISDMKSGDRVYAIGIGTSDTPDLIRSEWFDSDENISNFMSSDSFRLRYYVEDLPNFFKKDSGTNPSGDNIGNLGNITNTSGDVTGNINLEDIVGSGDTMAGSITLEDITSKIDFNIINNPYTELWDTIVNGFKTALTSRNPKSISFNIRETEVVINSDNIMLPQNEIKVFMSLFTNTAMLMAIFIQIQKIIIKAQEGDISSLLSVADEDIHFYDDMQMM